VTRIVELSEEGYSPRVIASSVGLSEEFVRVVLEQAEEVRSEAGEGASVGRQM
jgi:transposase